MSARDRAAAGDEPVAIRRTDEEIFTRAGIRIRMYARDNFVPVLPRRASREWRERFQATLQTLWGGIQKIDKGNAAGTVEMIGLADEVLDGAAEMVAAYDRDGILGGPDEIDAKATDEEVWEAAKAIAGYVYPFGKDLARFLPQVFEMLISAPGTATGSASSTDSASDDGTSAPDG